MLALCIATYEIADVVAAAAAVLRQAVARSHHACSCCRGRRSASPRALGDLWRAQRVVLWRQLLLDLDVAPAVALRALSRSRFISWKARRVGMRRRRQLSPGNRGAATLMTGVFSLVENLLVLALVARWCGSRPPSVTRSSCGSRWQDYAADSSASGCRCSMGMGMLLLEPFYVAAGFGMYLNRRTELEAWDVEQELRRAFASWAGSAQAVAAADVAARRRRSRVPRLPLSPRAGGTSAPAPTIGRCRRPPRRCALIRTSALNARRGRLRWRRRATSPRPDAVPAWLLWLREFFVWIGQSARLIVWVLCRLLAAFVVVYLLRLVARARPAQRRWQQCAPTHVRDLDIRPEACPTTSARPRDNSGTQAMRAARWPCCTAGCCRVWRMRIMPRCAIPPPRATR